MNITPADPTGGVSEIRESLFRNAVPEFLAKNERMVMSVAAGTVTGAVLGYYIESTTLDDSALVKHLRDDPNYTTDTSWKALKSGVFGALGGALVVGTVGYWATLQADDDARVAGTIRHETQWAPQDGRDRANCNQLQSSNPGNRGKCFVLAVELVRIDPLDFVRLGKRARDLHDVDHIKAWKHPYGWIAGVDTGATGLNSNGVVRKTAEEFQAAYNGAHVETGFLYYGLCTYTQAIPWGSPEAHDYCFGPRSPLSMRQRSTIASTVGTADLRRPQDWGTLSRAAQFVIITNCMLWAPSSEQTVVRFAVGGPDAITVANALRDQAPTRWMQTNELQEKDLTRKMLRIKALETLGGWYSATRDEQQFMVSAWGAIRPSKKPLDLTSELDVSDLVNVLKQVSPEYRDSGAYATAQRFKLTPAEIASRLEGNDRLAFIDTKKEAIMQTASMIGYTTERVSSSTLSDDGLVREFLKETIEIGDHVISRGWVWSWKELIMKRDAENRTKHWDQIEKQFQHDNGSVFTKLPENTPPEWRSDWTWKIPQDEWLATTDADRKLDGVLFQHDHRNNTYGRDDDVNLKLTTVLFVQHGNGNSDSTVGTTTLTRPITQLCIPSLLAGNDGDVVMFRNEYKYQLHTKQSLSFIQVFQSLYKLLISKYVTGLFNDAADDLVDVANALYSQYLKQYVGGKTERSAAIPNDPYIKNALHDCCWYDSNIVASGASTIGQMGGKYITIVNFPVHFHSQFMDTINSKQAQQPPSRAGSLEPFIDLRLD